jgi:leucyl-tRNA synthetase
LPTDNEALVKSSVELVVQINGKLRAKFEVAVDADEAVVRKKVEETQSLDSYFEGKTVRKVIFVPQKLINFVVN